MQFLSIREGEEGAFRILAKGQTYRNDECLSPTLNTCERTPKPKLGYRFSAGSFFGWITGLGILNDQLNSAQR